MLSSYSKVYHLGHKMIQGIFDNPVIVEEKVDGSQFSFGLIDGELQFRSRKAEIFEQGAPKMFAEAVEAVKARAHLLTPGMTYRCEYLQNPKHNVLAYDRVPHGHLMLFDAGYDGEHYLPWVDKLVESERLDIEVVPLLYEGCVGDITKFRSFLDRVSVLGGQKIEGVVVKNYAKFTRDGHFMVGKYVSEEFKETHRKDWKGRHPSNSDIVEVLTSRYKAPARLDKAIQHLREAGKITDSPRDIGPLMAEFRRDVAEECQDEIKAALWKHFWPKIARGIASGVPADYKAKLLAQAFEAPSDG
jgi:hypothetical protein